MDTPRPQDDFFTFVNGQWIVDHPIPPDESQWGSFVALHVEVQNQLKAIFENVAKMSDGELDATARKVRDFYVTGMDTATLNAGKDAPLAGMLKMVDDAADIDALVEVIGHLHRSGADVFWSVGVEQDFKNSEMMAFFLGQGGLSLPDRDYYLTDDEQNRAVREKYRAHANTMLSLATVFGGEGKSPAPVPEQFIALETRLARASMTRVEMRDLEKQYNKLTMAELAKLTPRVNWQRYFKGANIAATPTYAIVCQLDFMKEVDRIFGETPIDQLRAYMRWHILNDRANFLGEDFEKAVFEFYGRTFSGATEMKPRWRRIGGVLNALLGEAVGQLYVKDHFSQAAKDRVSALVDHLIAAYRARIEALDWMGPETKKKALEKLGAVKKKLGYPDKWKDYGPLVIGRESYLQNGIGAHEFEFDRSIAKIGKQVDRTEWYMSPQTVNACYAIIMNEVLFPAAFLQPPFFFPDGDDATNFGAVGAAIGHELTHGFDDMGSRFDLNGNMNQWWTPEDKARFDKKTAHLAEQFDVYEPLPGLHVNGKLTLGENIADLGGLLIAYDGLVHALGGADKITKEQEQVFFRAFAVSEQVTIRDESLRTQILTNPHAPGMYRVNGTLSNTPQFYEAYDVKVGDKLYREDGDRVKIW